MSESRQLVLDDGSVITRGETLRQLSGKREVFAGTWLGRAVIAKVFLDRRRAAVHARREANGLAAFHAAGVRAPKIVFSGADRAANPVLLIEQIAPAESLADRWTAADDEARQALMRQMMNLLAQQHQAGVCQTDLHLANFLLSNGELYSIDGDAVEVQAQPLDQPRSLQNLALFFSQLLPRHDAPGVGIAERYADRRGWPHALIERQLPGLIREQRLGRWLNLEPKLYRECSAIVHHRSAGTEYFAVRPIGEPLQRLAADPDATCPAETAQLLKNGNTATLWRTDVAGVPVVVKRYNIKNRRHALKLAGRRSRAEVSWSNAHMLTLFGIPTPRPLALAYRRQGALARVAYFIAEAQPGPDLLAWINDRVDDIDAIESMAVKVAELFRQLHGLRISHGDMKATNFIVHDESLYLIDLDALQRHRHAAFFDRAWQRDMRRYLANWSSLPAVEAAMREQIGELFKEP